MKIRSNIHAGTTFAECDVQRDCWKKQAELMETYANGSSSYPPAGLQFPPYTCASSTSGGGSSSGGSTYYTDMSGYCNPGTSGGSGSYNDMSGYCG